MDKWDDPLFDPDDEDLSDLDEYADGFSIYTPWDDPEALTEED